MRTGGGAGVGAAAGGAELEPEGGGFPERGIGRFARGGLEAIGQVFGEDERGGGLIGGDQGAEAEDVGAGPV